MKLTDRGLQGEVVKAEPSSTASASPSDSSINSINLGEAAINDDSGAALPEGLISTGHMNTLIAGKASETALLDERSLLTCIVRTIPAGGRIRISSTVSEFLKDYLQTTGILAFSACQNLFINFFVSVI